jgi:signal transduction histidine kinase
MPVSGLCFVCDQSGNILRVLRDDMKIFASPDPPRSFFSLFDLSNKSEQLQFWHQLRGETAINNWVLNVRQDSLTTGYKFSGIVTGDEIFITAIEPEEDQVTVREWLIDIINEEQNMLRISEKSLSELKKKQRFTDEDVLNEMTLLNNEAINTQRQLKKQNEQVTKLNTTLQRVNTDLEQFTSVASHDLKEPLRMVISFMTLLKKNYGDQLDKKAHTYIDFAIDGGRRMLQLVNDLLEISHVAHKEKITELVNVNEIVTDVNQNILRLIEETGAQIIVKTSLPVISASRTEITQLIQNLVSNAIKFRKKEVQPVISIAAADKKDVWLFSIEDNGIGIDKEKFGKIFDIFARLNSHDYAGSGIGLAICKKIVEMNGGEIWLTSEQGKGSTFYFTVPK